MHDARVADSPYFIKHSPARTYYGQMDHLVQVYHKSNPNHRVGYLSYDDEGNVGGMYIDHRHQGTMAATQMLVAAHRHLKDTIGNPIGLLRAENTSEQSGGLIKKIDPQSTYLQHDSAASGRNKSYVDDQFGHNSVPVRNDSLQKPIDEWEDLSNKSGRTVGQLMAMSYDPTNRRDAENWLRYEPDSPEKVDAIRLQRRLDANYLLDNDSREKRKNTILGSAAGDLVARRVHSVPGDMPVDYSGRDSSHWTHDFDLHGSLPNTYTQEELEKLYPAELATQLRHKTPGILASGARRAKPNNPGRDAVKGKAYFDPSIKANDPAFVAGIKNRVEGGADVIGTSGVWTGDEETDEKATLPAPPPKLPLDLNPYERVKRITKPLGDVLYVKDE